MTVHATLLLAQDTPASDGMATAYENVRQNRTPVLEDQRVPLTRSPAEFGVPAHRHGIERWASSETKADLLDALEAAVPTGTWYVIAYHECDHDEPSETRSGCPPWAVEREGSSPPPAVLP